MLQPNTVIPAILALLLQAATAYCAALQAADPAPRPGAHRPLAPGEPLPWDRLRWHIPDPEHDRPNAEQLLDDARARGDKAQVTYITRVGQRVEEIRRPVQMSLTLDEAIRTALEHNYDIEVASFDPAIQTTRVVEAQAAFDATFFTNIVKNNIDRPSGSQLTATDLD